MGLGRVLFGYNYDLRWNVPMLDKSTVFISVLNDCVGSPGGIALRI